ncbi:hypothetical protein VF_B0022 (plasmid) [Aliivibrio fischeri ES114]|uniref:Uncharacterized protein n=1 Tax=Aliivibrio fischeri (strain ATCC 700601 / ES114) TaxID=312309 RepID=Q5DY82_ALIF1|nr:hypothetical protein [Aliivibrio fischeri]AAW88264.1 hypothetical protein VF_B0022 [Aliivibrio fischeri ES114]KLU77239.1 hypothetical protein AB192_18775 [Aliivibrio fischeri]MBP3155214.1 hypothetical protein [Aliivibrio fischeri]MCE7575594.1 hypothetical protein [Aliivibrio fischeri]
MKKGILLSAITLLSFTAHAELINVSYDFSNEHQFEYTTLLPTSQPYTLSKIKEKKVITQWLQTEEGHFSPLYQTVTEGVNVKIIAKPTNNKKTTYQFDVQYFAPPTITRKVDSLSGFEVSVVTQSVTAFTETPTFIENKPVCNDEKFCVTLISQYPDEETENNTIF